ncbi:MAG: hypothetical protein R3B96_20035 [Pirellulaceae bacterium]
MSSHLADSYHRLLGIPPAEQPPSAWRLLGLNAGEKNEQVIRLAMEQRLAFLRTLQQGAVAEISRRLANEVSRAGITLLAGESPGPSAHGPTGTITATPPEARPPLPASMAPTAALAVSAATDSSAGLDSELEWRDDDPSDDFQLEPHDALADEYGLAESTAPVPAWVDEALAALPEPIRLKLEPHAHLLAPIAVGGAIGLVAMLPLTIGVIGVTRWLNRPAEEVAAVAPDPPEPSSETAIPDAGSRHTNGQSPVSDDGGLELHRPRECNDATVPSVVTMIADSVPLPPPGPLVANDDSAASAGDSTDTGTDPGGRPTRTGGLDRFDSPPTRGWCFSGVAPRIAICMRTKRRDSANNSNSTTCRRSISRRICWRICDSRFLPAISFRRTPLASPSTRRPSHGLPSSMA